MEGLPSYIPGVFFLTTVLTALLFFKAFNNSRKVLVLFSCWVLLQCILGLNEFYTVTDVMPPRFLLAVLPPFILIAALFVTAKGRTFIDKANLEYLTILHVIRIPVEVVLYWLFLHKAVPVLMTFEGWNLDIISGITAPFALVVLLSKNSFKRKTLLAWNLVCLALLINIVVIAILCLPFPFQKLAFDQPNIAVLYFPYVLLPAVIVPVVLFSQLVSIRQLLLNKQAINTDGMQSGTHAKNSRQRDITAIVPANEQV